MITLIATIAATSSKSPLCLSFVFFFLSTVLLRGGLIFGGNKQKREDVAKDFYYKKKDLALVVATTLFRLSEIEPASPSCSHWFLYIGSKLPGADRPSFNIHSL
jgi:hypothetical protein